MKVLQSCTVWIRELPENCMEGRVLRARDKLCNFAANLRISFCSTLQLVKYMLFWVRWFLVLQMLHQAWKISFAQERGVPLMIMSQNICTHKRNDLTLYVVQNFKFPFPCHNSWLFGNEAEHASDTEQCHFPLVQDFWDEWFDQNC